MGKIADQISKMHPLETIMRSMFLGLGLLFFAFAAWQAVRSVQTIATHDKVPAEVRECSANGSPGARFNTYDCSVRFISPMGRHSATIEDLLFAYDPGDAVEIYVGRGDQYSIKAGGFNGLWGVATLLTVIGTMFFGFGAWPSRSEKKRRYTRPPGGQPPISK